MLISSLAETWEIMMHLMVALKERSSRTNSTPSMTGMKKSTRTTSGLARRTSWTSAGSPPQSPQISPRSPDSTISSRI